MISQRITVERAEPPTRKSVEACVKACLKYRERMANSVGGSKPPSLRERMAVALLDAWDEIEVLNDTQSELLAHIEDLEV